MEFNEKQKSVIFHKPDNNILVSAAAGSGKTSVLVWRIINLILNDKENDYTLSDFLVMTFTIKAAGEMKARIKSALDEMLFEDPQNEKLIRESSIIQNANISTIDSFCKKILEENYTMLDDSNSLYGNFDPAYRVLDGKEMDVLYDDVIERFFENKYDDAKYYKLLEAYTKKASDKDLREMCVKGLKFLGSIPFADEYLNNKIVLHDKDSEKACSDFIKKKIDLLNDKKENINYIDSCINEYVAILKKSIDDFSSVKDAGETAAKTAIDKCIKSIDYFEKDFRVFLNTFIETTLDLDKVADLYEKYVSIGKPIYPNKNQVTADEAEYKKVADKVKEIYKDFGALANYSQYKDIPSEYKHNEIEKLFLEFLYEFYIEVAKEKKKRNVLDISDFAKLSLDILYDKKVNSAGIIDRVISKRAEEIGEKYKIIFIDEYQDTNLIQEKLIAALSLDFKKKNVFMVGDIKQGIYRFRHAELSIFADKYDLYNGNRELGEPITLDENYRSRKEILMYVNDLFSKIMKKNYGRVDYAKEGVFEIPESSMESATSDETKVEVVVINKEIEEVANLNSDDNEEDSDETIDASNESSKDKNNYTESDYEGDYVARRIRELVDSGKYDYKDIVILHRAAGTKGKYFLDALTRYHIPVYSEQKKGFFDRQEVKLIISILNVIDNPLQNIHVASVITSNIYNISNEELAFIKLAYYEYLGLSKKDDYMLYDALIYLNENADNLTEKAKDYNIDLPKLQNRINMFLKMVDSLSFKSRYLSISELINLIYEKMNVRNIALAMRDGKMRAANLEVLYKFARNYENSSYVGLFNFLRYIEKIKQLDDDTGLAKLYDENDNVVKIMTVHSSKGLEFKVVFMCGTGNKYNEMDLKDSNSCYYNQKYCVANKFFDLDKKYSINTPKREYVLMETADLNRQEELRVLYVALTRAKEKLIIVGFARETRLGGYSIAQLNEFKENFANGKNMPSLVKDCNCYLDLILKNYPTSGDYCIFKNESINLDLSEEKAIDEFDFSKINQIDEEEKIIEQNKNYKEYLQKFSEESLLNTTTDNYEYRDLQKIEPKFSVSSIKQRIHDTLNNTLIAFVDENLYDDADVAIEDSVAKTIKDGAAIGNAYHRYMQFYNYTANKYDCKNEKETENSCEKIISTDKIEKFVASDIGKRMAVAFKNNRLYREQKFMKLFSLADINEYLSGEAKIDTKNIKESIVNEKNIVIQGIIDAFIVEKDASGKEFITLLDYKTDYLSKEKINRDLVRQNLIENYSIQLDIYAKTLEELTGLKVSNKYIYSFALDEEIKL